jgi:hypothetical protein
MVCFSTHLSPSPPLCLSVWVVRCLTAEIKHANQAQLCIGENNFGRWALTSIGKLAFASSLSGGQSKYAPERGCERDVTGQG